MSNPDTTNTTITNKGGEYVVTYNHNTGSEVLGVVHGGGSRWYARTVRVHLHPEVNKATFKSRRQAVEALFGTWS